MPNKNFVIPQLDEEENISKEEESVKKEVKQENKSKIERFVSPIYGTKVKDEDYYPHVSYNNGGRQYDSFRDKKDKKRIDDFKDYIIGSESSFSDPLTRNAFGGDNEITNENDNATLGDDLDKAYDYETFNEEEKVSDNQNDKYKDLPYYEEYLEFLKTKEAKTQENSFESEEEHVENDYSDDYDANEFEDLEEENVDEDYTDDRMYASMQSEVRRDSFKESKQVKPRIEYKKAYSFPPLSLLRHKNPNEQEDFSGVQKQREIIDRTLGEFGIRGRVVSFTKGPTVTLFEVQLEPGVKYNRIPEIQFNLQGNLEAISIRIEAPIPGKSTVGIEVPNLKRDVVYFGDMISNDSFLHDNNPLNVVLGLDISGTPIYLDIKKMPHGLIAGSTGSGKSVCINAVIVSILYKAHPDDVKLILIDPKKVEFAKYNGIPHLACPIITDNSLAAQTLSWAVEEMENRYELFASVGASNYKEYLEYTNQDKDNIKHIPYIVIIIDEYADLVTAGADVESSVMRLTAKARAAGLHLLVCTQRPSVNVINGTIKTNIPTRIAFKVNKTLDSQIILDRSGAEKLLGNGDMMYDEENGRQRRIQGAYIDGAEIKEVVQYLKSRTELEYMFTSNDLKKKAQLLQASADDPSNDDMFYDIARYIVESNNASINNIQKKFGCGFNRVQSIVQKLAELGVVSQSLGSKARTVLVDMDKLEDIFENM